MVSIILIAGILVGLYSFPSISNNAALPALDIFVQFFFTVEVVLKVVSEGRFPLNFW
jgi:hypothetical protein